MNERIKLEERALERIESYIYERSLLRFSNARWSNLKTRVQNRAVAAGFNNCDDYARHVETDPEEFQSLLECLTTHETYPFRIPGQFEVLKNRVLPEIEDRLSSIALRPNPGGPAGSMFYKQPFRIWSAGCSTGEEADSIAMTLLETLRFSRAWEIEILATDLSRPSLQRASSGRYETRMLDRIPRPLRRKYFLEDADGGDLSPNVRQWTRFGQFNLHNLITQPIETQRIAGLDGSIQSRNMAETFDILFCRNVMIYFDLKAQQRLLDRLYECLRPGGYLFTGDAEPLHLYRHGFQTLAESGVCVYRKPEMNQ